MVIPSPDPISAISSSINATIKILEVTYQLKAVDEQTADLLATTRHVDFMLQHAHRLRRLKAALLNANERTMIDTVISDTEDALRAVAKLVEPCRVDKTTKNTIRFGHRVMWVFRDNPSVRDKHQKLQVCHQSLGIVFSCLYSKDVVVIAPIPETIPERRSEDQPPPYDPQIKELLDWQKRRKGRRSVGERDLGLTNGSPDVTPVACPSSPCLLAIQLDDGGTLGLSTDTEMSFEPSAIPTFDAQHSAPLNNDEPLNSSTASSENQSSPSHVNAQDSLTCEEIRTMSPNAHTYAHHDYIGPVNCLPKIDISPFATMIASYNVKNDEKDALQVDGEDRTHTAISAWNQAPDSSATASGATPSATPLLPSLPSSAAAISASSKLSTGEGLWLRSLEALTHSSNGSRGPTEVSTPGQHPPGAKINSDIQSSNTYQSDRLDAIARVEDVISKDNKALSVGQGRMKKGGRSWLAYHATRSDMGHGIDWDG